MKATELVLEAAAKKKKLVFVASTSEVYGKNNKIPFCEDDDILLGPTTKSRWSYATSKALDEFLGAGLLEREESADCDCAILQHGGPRQTGRYGMVLPTFVGQALDGKPLTVYGSGQQSRCFGYVGDVIEAMLRLVATDRAVGQVVNIGNDKEITIEGLARLVKQKTASNSPLRSIAYEQAYEPGFEDMFRRVPSLEKLVRLTGYRPTTQLDPIIDMVAADLQSRRDVTTLVQPVYADEAVGRIVA